MLHVRTPDSTPPRLLDFVKERSCFVSPSPRNQQDNNQTKTNGTSDKSVQPWGATDYSGQVTLHPVSVIQPPCLAPKATISDLICVVCCRMLQWWTGTATHVGKASVNQTGCRSSSRTSSSSTICGRSANVKVRFADGATVFSAVFGRTCFLTNVSHLCRRKVLCCN